MYLRIVRLSSAISYIGQYCLILGCSFNVCSAFVSSLIKNLLACWLVWSKIAIASSEEKLQREPGKSYRRWITEHFRGFPRFKKSEHFHMSSVFNSDIQRDEP